MSRSEGVNRRFLDGQADITGDRHILAATPNRCAKCANSDRQPAFGGSATVTKKLTHRDAGGGAVHRIPAKKIDGLQGQVTGIKLRNKGLSDGKP